MAEDAAVRTPGGSVYVGREQIGAYAQGLIAQHHRAEGALAVLAGFAARRRRG